MGNPVQGVNDSLDHARELSALLSDRPVIVGMPR